MRLMTAVAVVLFCLASGCDKSSSSTSSKKDLPPDMQEQNTRAATAPATPASAPATQAALGTPINKFCAVETKNEIDPKVTTVYQGKTIGFCCKDCIPDFEKDPAKYMASLK